MPQSEIELMFQAIQNQILSRKFRGLRFVATDVPWAAGKGQEVHGPIAGLLLTLAGRAAALDQLEGDGKDDLRTRVLPSNSLNKLNRTA